MKINKLCYLTVLIVSLYACIKDAPANPEADIETFTIPKRYLTGDVFIDQANRKIMLYLTPAAFDSGVVPTLTLSAGATVSPASGDSLLFDSTIVNEYVVTSASGNMKTYTVEVIGVGTWKWDFENWGLNDNDKYQYPVEEDGTMFWSSGNPGIALSGVKKDPLEYPLRRSTDAYHGQYAAELVTRAGTALSNLIGIKLFAGSLFVGVFDPSSALAAPLKATQFGQPYAGKPSRFIGYYKYQPGEKYQDKAGNIIADMKDSCSIYAVLYRGTTRLDATNIHTSDRIVATASIPDGGPRAVWTRFDIPFTQVRPYAAAEKLMLAIVASSSQDGDSYKGAIGSRLVLDSVQVIHQ
ncbi:PCMD domain-containing protein [Chitinophaga arvensicola]|uniref:Putative carbohydrate metabolism domain-containing protein n=1 Tax=Chitinophaga arvensicola TaxID=29529 RepID=A0A1I0S656_9BACT|nr:PCMD domain-containing protein [Chitinophaga arvensicola]SEW50684.1 Putative carbohydrate metabolism domain-containing protein [Chitinophaga arvensicola]